MVIASGETLKRTEFRSNDAAECIMKEAALYVSAFDSTVVTVETDASASQAWNSALLIENADMDCCS